jgi:hypothetical protein
MTHIDHIRRTSMRRIAVVTTTALALMATPAFAQGQSQGQGDERRAQGQGLSTAPGQICKNQPRKKNSGGKGKSAFAICVLGARRANADHARVERLRAQGQDAEEKAPGQMCKDQPKTKPAGSKKTSFAICVTGAAKAQRRHRQNEQS